MAHWPRRMRWWLIDQDEWDGVDSFGIEALVGTIIMQLGVSYILWDITTKSVRRSDVFKGFGRRPFSWIMCKRMVLTKMTRRPPIRLILYGCHPEEYRKHSRGLTRGDAWRNEPIGSSGALQKRLCHLARSYCLAMPNDNLTEIVGE